MNKFIDFYDLFQEYFMQWYDENADKYSDEQVEDLVPKIYADFFESYNEKIGCKPYQFYEKHDTDALVEGLDSMLSQGMQGCDILIMEIIKRKCTAPILERLKKATNDAAIMTYCNLLSDLNSKVHIPTLVELLFNEKMSTDVRDLAVELLHPHADIVASKLTAYRGDSKDIILLICDVIASCKKKELAIDFLIEKFVSGIDTILLSNYLSKLGDSKALPCLYAEIEREDIDYYHYLELRNAIESLGGEVAIEKDFSNDPYYREMNP